MTDYSDFFHCATGHDPYPYQERLALSDGTSGLLSVPTGAGKTAAVVLAWLWRRRYADPETRRITPRRLVYCLPMRTLVEQTADVVRGVLASLRLPVVDWQQALRAPVSAEAVGLAVAMGGEPRVDWDLFPELDLVVVGTQDMLLSRALNRGYGSSRYRWPLAFGLLNNDAMWVHDEVQLMGDGLATSTQMAGLRRKLGAWGTPTELWLSATVRREWLASVDFEDWADRLTRHDLAEEDRARPELAKRLHAPKTLERLPVTRSAELAEAVIARHRPGVTTLVILNTVARAVDVYEQVRRRMGASRPGKPGAEEAPELVLLHSRYRPPDRRAALEKALGPCPPSGRIVVSTQVVEAGVDMSAATLFTDLAPWPALVQRIGRCNRAGEFRESDDSRVVVVERDPERDAAPYESADMALCADMIRRLGDGAAVSPAALEEATSADAGKLLRYEPSHVLRRRDLLELFDTTPDIAGNDIDVSRFVRNVKETDALVFWRTDPLHGPPELPPWRDELCPVPVGDLRSFVDGSRERGHAVLVWDHLTGEAAKGAWVPAVTRRVRPGEVYLVAAEAGGYSPELGWQPRERGPVAVVPRPDAAAEPVLMEADGDDAYSEAAWQTVAEHTDEVVRCVQVLLDRLAGGGLWDDAADHVKVVLNQAARWHDRGKAHPVFQGAIQRPQAAGSTIWAKAPGQAFGNFERYGFRHELAGALAARDLDLEDLVWYLVAAHHGKVRLTLRALPDENLRGPQGAYRVRGLQEGDELPETPLGDGVVAPAVRLSLDAAALGRDERGRTSWSEAVLQLRDGWPGPFRLAFLEALLRCADVRASALAATPTGCSADDQPGRRG